MPFGAIPANGLLLVVTLTTKTAPVVKAASTTKLSTGAIVAAVLAALLIVVCLVWAVARWWAYEPRWKVSLRHCFAEASWRLAGAWGEFADWLRLGR
jgi:amino acid transporter